MGVRAGAVVRPLAFHQCGSGSIPRLNAWLCGLSLLLVLYSAPRGSSPGKLVFPSPQKHISKFQFDRDAAPPLKTTSVSGASWVTIMISFFLSFFLSFFIYVV